MNDQLTSDASHWDYHTDECDATKARIDGMQNWPSACNCKGRQGSSKESHERKVLACDKVQFTLMEDGRLEVYIYGDPGPFEVAKLDSSERKELIEWLRPADETGALREALENISTVRPLEHFPAVTALAYCREKAIEALNATSAFQEVIVGEYEADGKVSMASSPLPEGTKLYARLPLRHSEKAVDQPSPVDDAEFGTAEWRAANPESE